LDLVWPDRPHVDGRFVKQGSCHEAFALGAMNYTAEHIQKRHITILGKVYAAFGPAERITPTAS
jgi:hypothetical protein